MKLLSIAIPCYNSEAYMEKCIDSLLVGGEEVEILIVDDGSKDGTTEIADRYQEKYPTIVKAIHQENGGHGEAVNAGIRNATGLYFKVVDSDDWVNEEAYKQILKTLEELTRGPKTLDMLISNFVYEKQGASRKKVMQYRRCLPVNEIFGWDSVHMSKGKYLLMHSIIYRTKLLHECGLELPKHTFYVDNLFAFEPLPFVKNMYYLDVNFYRYFIGRDDQSVNEKVMIGRIDQQIKVNKLMIDAYDLTKIKNKKLRDAVMKFCQARLSPPLIGQIVAEASIDAPRSYSTEVYEEYIERRKCLIDGLNRIPGVYSPIPMGAFYTVARLPVEDSDDFCAWCLSDFEYEGETVMLAPASGFYSDPTRGRNEVRIAYVLKKEDLERSLLILGKALEAYNNRK